MVDKPGDTFTSKGYKYRLEEGADGKLRPTYLGKAPGPARKGKSGQSDRGEVYGQILIAAMKAAIQAYKEVKEEERERQKTGDRLLLAVNAKGYSITERVGGFKYKFVKLVAVDANGKRTEVKVRGRGPKCRCDAIYELAARLGIGVAL